MYLAKPVLGEVVVSYDNKDNLQYDVNISGNVIPTRQNKNSKIANKPTSAYHEWLAAGAVEFPRKSIIESLMQRASTAATAKKPVNKKSDELGDKQKKWFDKKVAMYAKSELKNRERINARRRRNGRQLMEFRTSVEEYAVAQATRAMRVSRTFREETDTSDEDIVEDVEENSDDDSKVIDLNRPEVSTPALNRLQRRVSDDDPVAEYKRYMGQTDNSDSKGPNLPTTEEEKIEQLFKLLEGLHWRDRDDAVMNINQLNKINLHRLEALLPTMHKLADEIYVTISSKLTILEDFTNEQKYNFLYHIIAMGKQFYFSVIEEPNFCAYLSTDENNIQYQPLYTFIKRKFP